MCAIQNAYYSNSSAGNDECGCGCLLFTKRVPDNEMLVDLADCFTIAGFSTLCVCLETMDPCHVKHGIRHLLPTGDSFF